MPASEIAIVRRALAALNRGDLESFVALHDTGWEGYVSPTTGEFLSGSWHGRKGLQELVELWLEPWSRFTVEPSGFDVAGDALLVDVHAHGAGTASGAEVEMDWVFRYEVRDGTLSRLGIYADREEALRGPP